MDYSKYWEGLDTYMGRGLLIFSVGFLVSLFGCIMFFGVKSLWIMDSIFGLAFLPVGLLLMIIVMAIQYKKNLPFRIFNKAKKKIGKYIDSDNMLWELTMNSVGDIDLKNPICPKPECESYIYITYAQGSPTPTLHTCGGCKNQWDGRTLEMEKYLAMTKLKKKREELHLYEPDRIAL